MSADCGVWAAPGRINLIGEHTDYNDGYVLPFALAQQTTVTASRLAEPEWHISSTQRPEAVRARIDDLVPGRIGGWAGYVAGVVWALREAGHDVPGARLALDSDVPVGAGLSSSAAMECAVLAALCDLGGFDIPEPERARLAQRAENDYVGMPCGIMDQSASIRGREGYALFLDCRTLAAEQIPCDLSAAGLVLLVVDSRAQHAHVDNEYAQRRHACETAAKILGVPALRDIDDLDAALAALDEPVLRRRVRHVVTEDARVLETVALLRAGDIRAIGPLMSASHASMRDDYEITVPEVDLVVEVATASGAYGARMTGGGFGGCVLALVDAEAAGPVEAAVRTAYAEHGFAEPAAFLATPSAGARRIA